MECESPFVFFYTYFYQLFCCFMQCALMESVSKFDLQHLYQCVTSVLHMLMCSSTYACTYSFASLWKISNSIKKLDHLCTLSGVFRIGINPSTAVCLNEDLLEEPQRPTRTASCKQTLNYCVVSIHSCTSSFLVLIRPGLHLLYFIKAIQFLIVLSLLLVVVVLTTWYIQSQNPFSVRHQHIK